MFDFINKERFRYTDASTRLAVIRFIFSLGTAGVGVVWSLYMNSLGFSESAIGYIAGILTLVSLFLSVKDTTLLEKFGEKKIFVTSLIIYIFSYVSIAVFRSTALFILISFLVTIAAVLRTESFAIIYRDSISNNKDVSRKEGLLYSLANLGWFIAPAFAGFLLAKYGYPVVFYLSALMFAVSLVIFSLNRGRVLKKNFKRSDGNLIGNIRKYFSRKELLFPYTVSAGLCLIDSFIIIYMPLFLFKRGLPVEYIGILISVMALIHAIFDFKIGDLVNKYGFKKFLVLGFLASAATLIIAGFISDVYVLFYLIMFGSFFTIFIEPLQDSYFFSKISRKEDEEKFFPIFSTAAQIGAVIAKIVTATILLFLAEKYTYWAIAFIMAIVGILILFKKERKN